MTAKTSDNPRVVFNGQTAAVQGCIPYTTAVRTYCCVQRGYGGGACINRNHTLPEKMYGHSPAGTCTRQV